MQRTKITFNLKGLEELKKQVGDTYRARVGILGKNAEREEGEAIDNATLGLIQLFGSITKNIPPRDFLRMPIETHGKEIAKAMGSDAVKKAMEAGDYKKVFALLGAQGEVYVQQAFESAGFGQWPPNAPATIARKKSDRPLIDTGQLRRAITSDVVKKDDIL